MSDIIDAAFLAPYPAADVYGLGIAGAPAPEAQPPPSPAQVEPMNGAGSAEGSRVPSGEPAGEAAEGLGRHVDVRV